MPVYQKYGVLLQANFVVYRNTYGYFQLL